MILSHKRKLEALKNTGYQPTLVVDIGAFIGEWTKTCQTVFPEAKYYLVEPNMHEVLEPLKSNSNVRVLRELLFEQDQLVPWFSINFTGDSIFQETTKYYAHTNPTVRKAIRMETLMIRYQLSFENERVFVKLDTQGSETHILRGFSKETLEKIDFILMELPFFGRYNYHSPTFLESIQFMDSIGFIPYDLFEEHFMLRFNTQIDMLFIRKTHPFVEEVRQDIANW
jgi:FkbM family methyltransferase